MSDFRWTYNLVEPSRSTVSASPAPFEDAIEIAWEDDDSEVRFFVDRPGMPLVYAFWNTWLGGIGPWRTYVRRTVPQRPIKRRAAA